MQGLVTTLWLANGNEKIFRIKFIGCQHEESQIPLKLKQLKIL